MYLSVESNRKTKLPCLLRGQKESFIVLLGVRVRSSNKGNLTIVQIDPEGLRVENR